MPTQTIEQKKYQNLALTLLSLVLSVYGSFRYLIFGHRHFDENDPFDVGLTPFTSNIFLIFIYWVVLYSFQALFVLQYLVPEGNASRENSRLNVASVVGSHFTIFNVLTFVWSILFSKGHYILSEMIVIVNFFNILVLVFVHKTYAIKGFQNFLMVHVPTAALPFSWLLYLLFWNGAAVFRSSSGFVARILANIFIWNFLLVPMMFLGLFGDWATGFSSSFLMLGLGFGQLFTKVFALQWIFAFVISGLLFFFSLVALAGLGSTAASEAANTRSDERAPLLTGDQNV